MGLGPRLIFWEITQRCNLRCPYCRRQDYFDRGLTKEASLRLITDIAKDYNPILVFSGGEPLLYPYIFEVTHYAKARGLKTALATNATIIDENLARKIKLMNFHRVAVSLDGASQDIHDALRGEGTFVKIISGIKRLKSEGIELQINTTVLRRNFKEISQIYNLCLDLGISALHIFAFVPVGCGITVPKEERLRPEEYEDFLNEMAQFSLKSKIEIKLTCAPHYQRKLIEKKRDLPSPISKPSPCAQGLGKGCLAGSGVCFISSEGEVYPCGYLAVSAGNIFKNTFREIWENSRVFQTLRNSDYLKGRCGSCEYTDICGGCRARAWAATGDYLEEEPDCIYQPLNVKS